MRLAGWKPRAMLQRYGASVPEERARETHRRLSPGDWLSQVQGWGDSNSTSPVSSAPGQGAVGEGPAISLNVWVALLPAVVRG
jgi:hypothetical protein